MARLSIALLAVVQPIRPNGRLPAARGMDGQQQYRFIKNHQAHHPAQVALAPHHLHPQVLLVPLQVHPVLQHPLNQVHLVLLL